MAALGSMYLYWTMGEDIITYGHRKQSGARSPNSDSGQQYRGRRSDEHRSPTRITRTPPMMQRHSSENNGLGLNLTITAPDEEPNSVECIEYLSARSDTEQTRKSNAGRSRIRKWFENVSEVMTETAHRELDTSDFRTKTRHADKWPMTPGEELKNKEFYSTSEQYAELKLQRAASRPSSIRSANGGEGPSSPPAVRVRSRSGGSADFTTPVRRDTLEVPVALHHNPRTVPLGPYQGATSFG